MPHRVLTAHQLMTSLRSSLIIMALSWSILLPAQIDTVLTTKPDTTRQEQPQLPIFTLTADDLDAELGAQDISGISARPVIAFAVMIHATRW